MGDVGLYGRKRKEKYLKSWKGGPGAVQPHLEAGGGMRAGEDRSGYHTLGPPATGSPAAREARGMGAHWGAISMGPRREGKAWERGLRSSCRLKGNISPKKPKTSAPFYLSCKNSTRS